MGVDVADADVRIGSHANADEPHHAQLRSSVGENIGAAGTVGIDKDDAVARHHAQQALKGEFDGLHIRVNVRVVHLNIADDDHLGQVVEELGAFVEERRVVLIALQHGEITVGEATATPQIARNTADHEAGIERIVLHQPREHG